MLPPLLLGYIEVKHIAKKMVNVGRYIYLMAVIWMEADKNADMN